MENKLPNENSVENGENPLNVLFKVVLTTALTLVAGWLIMFFGLI